MGDFLGTGGTFAADFNLLAQIVLGLTLLGGMVLARRKHYRAHQYVQTSVVVLNLFLIAFIMDPAFRNQVEPEIPAHLGMAYYLMATVHATVGVIAEALGLYVVLAAGTKLLPQRLRFTNFKLWMRSLLVIWWVALLLGLGTYYVWYLAPSTKVNAHAGSHGAHAFTVLLSDYVFTPKKVTVAAGTKVTWVDTQGTHQVVSNTNAFSSPVLNAGNRYSFIFERAGTYNYQCAFHGGIGMVGEIVVR